MPKQRAREYTYNRNIGYTGERVVPNETPSYIYQEHINRYFFAAQFTRGKTVLDVGCGVGSGASYLLRKGATLVIGGDIFYDALSFLKTHYKYENLYPVRLDATSLPFSTEQIDVVVSFETIEHLHEYKRFLTECYRVLKRGGIFICSTPNKRIDLIWRGRPHGAFHIHEFFPDELAQLISDLGYEVALFGQCPTTLIQRLKFSLFGLQSKLLLSLPNGFKIRERFVKILRKRVSIARLGIEIRDEHIDKEYGILPFRNCCSYIIVLAKKR